MLPRTYGQGTLATGLFWESRISASRNLWVMFSTLKWRLPIPVPPAKLISIYNFSSGTAFDCWVKALEWNIFVKGLRFLLRFSLKELYQLSCLIKELVEGNHRKT